MHSVMISVDGMVSDVSISRIFLKPYINIHTFTSFGIFHREFEVAPVPPTGSPGVLDQPVVHAVLSAVADYIH